MRAKKAPPAIRPQMDATVVVDIEENLRRGVTRKRALRAAGFDREQVAAIESLGRSGVEPYATTLVMMDKAEAEAEARLVRVIAESKDWRAAEALLKRRFPDDWGDKIQVEVKQQIEEMFRIAEEVLPEEWFTRFVDAVATGGESPAPGGAGAPAQAPDGSGGLH